MIFDTKTNYGLISRVNHWLSALLIIGLYFLGSWMVDLDYYSQWYTDAPHFHKSIGLLVALITLFRFFWKQLTPSPEANIHHSKHVKVISKIAHSIIYLCLSIIFISGYLISTADGREIAIFNLFSIPSLGEIINNQEDIAGFIHINTTDFLMIIVIFHILATLKHQFIDKDSTLTRMFK